MIIKQVNLSELKGISKNTLEKVLSYRIGKKTDTYWVFPIIAIGYISHDNGVNAYNKLMNLCQANGFYSLQIINS
jgi:hypothetical protein